MVAQTLLKLVLIITCVIKQAVVKLVEVVRRLHSQQNDSMPTYYYQLVTFVVNFDF